MLCVCAQNDSKFCDGGLSRPTGWTRWGRWEREKERDTWERVSWAANTKVWQVPALVDTQGGLEDDNDEEDPQVVVLEDQEVEPFHDGIVTTIQRGVRVYVKNLIFDCLACLGPDALDQFVCERERATVWPLVCDVSVRLCLGACRVRYVIRAVHELV